MFKDLVKNLTKRTFLLDAIKKDLVIYKKIPPPDETTRLRASRILHICPREEALAHKFKVTREESFTAETSLIFEHGRAFEVSFRDKFLAKSGFLVGTSWSCNNCSARYDFETRVPKPKKCDKCKSEEFRYIEIEKVDEETNIGGSADGFLNFNEEEWVFDLKTANEQNYKTFRLAPKEDHKAQLMVYMHLHGYKKGKLIYFNKNTGDMREHVVNYEPSYAGNLFNKGVQLKLYFEKGIVPERICLTAEYERAKKCSLCQTCFSKEAP